MFVYYVISELDFSMPPLRSSENSGWQLLTIKLGSVLDKHLALKPNSCEAAN